MRTVAVDFGTTASCAAVDDGDGHPTLIPQGAGTRMPSAVYAGEDDLVVGEYAARTAGYDRSRFDPTPKRLISQGQRFAPLGDTPVALTKIVAKVVSATLHDVAPDQIVATHPARWNTDQVKILTTGFERVGCPEIRTVAEPVAAAWAVIHPAVRRPGARYAIFDWGGGTFDAAVVEWDGARFEVTGAPIGEDPLGGEDLDQVLQEKVAALAGPDAAAELATDSATGRRLRHQLRVDIRQVKEQLSSSSTARVQVGETWVPVTRAEFEELARPFVDRCVATLQQCLANAGLQPADVAGVYLTGDSTRIPLVAQRIRELTGIELPITPPYDAKGVVALGAVMCAPTLHAAPATAAPAPAPVVHEATRSDVADRPVGRALAPPQPPVEQPPQPAPSPASTVPAEQTARPTTSPTAPAAPAATGVRSEEPGTDIVERIGTIAVLAGIVCLAITIVAGLASPGHDVVAFAAVATIGLLGLGALLMWLGDFQRKDV